MQSVDSYTWEVQLTQTLTTGLIVTAVVLVIFSVVRLLIPAFYNTKQTRYLNPFVWFITLFFEPTSVYANIGNQALLFIIFSNEILKLFFILALIFSVTLIPVYFLGQMKEFDFRTIWSIVSLAHIESGSIMHIVPMFLLIISSVIMVQFYKEFKDIYINFRQQLFSRGCPENYTVLLYDLPKELKTQEQLLTSLQDCFQNIKQIIPVPKSTKVLNKLMSKLRGEINYEYTLYMQLSQLSAKLSSLMVPANCDIYIEQYKKIVEMSKDDLDLAEQQFFQSVPNDKLKVIKQYLKNKKKYAKDMEKLKNKIIVTFVSSRNIKIQIIAEAYKYKINLTHLDGIKSLPPPLPFHITSFHKLSTIHHPDPIIRTNIQIQDQILQVQKAKALNQLSSEIGNSCFLIFSTHQETYKAAQTRLYPKSSKPVQSMAPSPYQIKWDNLSLSRVNKVTRKIIVIVVVLVIFFVYLQFWNPTYSRMKKREIDLNLFFTKLFTTESCYQAAISESDNISGLCSFGYAVGDFLGGFLPGFINSLMYSFMPLLYNLAFGQYGNITAAQTKQQVHIMTFVHLLTQFVILQVLLIRPKDDLFVNISEMLQLSLPEYLQIFQINMVNNVFELIAYIINQYVVWPEFSIWRLGDLFLFAIMLIIGKKDTISIQRLFVFIDYNINQTLAYLAHCLVSGLIFAVFDPLIVPLVFLAIIMHQIVIRYIILQVYAPGPNSDVSNMNDVFGYIPQYLYYSFLSGVILFAIYMMADLSHAIHIVVVSITVILAIILIVVKVFIDKEYSNSDKTGNLATMPGDELYKKTFKNNYFEILKSTKYHDLDESYRLVGDNMPILQHSARRFKGKRDIVSYLYPDGVIFDDYKSEVANLESFEDITLTDKETRNVASFFTHPALSFAQVYGLDKTAIEVI